MTTPDEIFNKKFLNCANQTRDDFIFVTEKAKVAADGILASLEMLQKYLATDMRQARRVASVEAFVDWFVTGDDVKLVADTTLAEAEGTLTFLAKFRRQMRAVIMDGIVPVTRDIILAADASLAKMDEKTFHEGAEICIELMKYQVLQVDCKAEAEKYLSELEQYDITKVVRSPVVLKRVADEARVAVGEALTFFKEFEICMENVTEKCVAAARGVMLVSDNAMDVIGKIRGEADGETYIGRFETLVKKNDIKPVAKAALEVHILIDEFEGRDRKDIVAVDEARVAAALRMVFLEYFKNLWQGVSRSLDDNKV